MLNVSLDTKQVVSEMLFSADLLVSTQKQQQYLFNGPLSRTT